MTVERITKVDVDRLAACISESLAGEQKIERQGRNGYQALDLYDGAACLTVLHIGTSRECYTYLQGWHRGHLTSA